MLNNGMNMVNKGLGIAGAVLATAMATYHWSEGKRFRAITDLAGITGIPLNLIPDALNIDISAWNNYMSMMSYFNGAPVGVQSFEQNFIINPRDYNAVSF